MFQKFGMGNRNWKFENFEKSRLEWMKVWTNTKSHKGKGWIGGWERWTQKEYLHQFANGSLADEQRILNIQEKNRSD